MVSPFGTRDGFGAPGLGNFRHEALDETTWLFLGFGVGGPIEPLLVVPGDVVRISGAATNGAYVFGIGDANTFSLPPSDDYTMQLGDVDANPLSIAVPEPSSFVQTLLATTTLMGLRWRRRTRFAEP